MRKTQNLKNFPKMLLLNKKQSYKDLYEHLKIRKKFLYDVDYKFIYSSGSAPAIIYDLPKIHKVKDSDYFAKLDSFVNCFFCRNL